MPLLQDSIHKLEEGGGMRFVHSVLAILVVLFLGVLYDWRAYRNMYTEEAMDAAQLARNLSEGKGYSTLCIRPFSMYLLKRHAAATGTHLSDPARLKEAHPDLANPPVYPLVLAGLMKVKHFEYPLPSKPKPFWNQGTRFFRYQPDFVIAVFNQFLFVAATGLVFLLARRLFDPGVAWLSSILMLTTEIFWRFSVSGLSTMLLILLFLMLVWALTLLEEEGRSSQPRVARQFALALGAGLLTAVCGLTRYSAGWLILPVGFFLFTFGGSRRIALGFLALAMFAAAMLPWIARNYAVSGTPFGTAGYAILQSTGLFPENKLMRSLEPDFSRIYLTPFWVKLMVNSRQLITNELPRLGGSWVTALFLAGLLIRFRNPAITRLRFFMLACVVVLGLAQALGRTQLSEDSLEINSENLLVLLLPLILVYGVSLFFLLLEQLNLSLKPLRYLVIGGFGLLVSLPMVFAFLPPRTSPVSYPPYYPPVIQVVSSWMKEKEMAMSDIPWAVAWYGQRSCVLLTLNSQSDFLAIHDYQKPVSVLYVTPVTMNSPFKTQWVRSTPDSWEQLITQSVLAKSVPTIFPLNHLEGAYWPEAFILTDTDRTRRSPPPGDSPAL